MNAAVAALRPGRGVPALGLSLERERSVRRRVGITWGLLVFNVLTYFGTVVPIPSSIGKGLTQAVLPVALLLALSVNRRMIIRPNVFLCLASLLVVETIMTVLQKQPFGTYYRTVRLAEFVAVLWLLTPWWGRRDMLLVRCHLKTYAVVLGSVLVGVLVAPGKAIGGGRLAGAIWGIPPTQVAHYGAVTAGLMLVLWLGGQLPGRMTLIIVLVTFAMLVLTHTRTALVGLVAGVLIAGLSLIVAKARVRKLFAAASVTVTIGILTLSGFLTTWLARGETGDSLTNLTGRTKVWGPLVSFPRDKFQEIMGFGLSNSSFNGLPIDSNWLASYQEQGLVGVTVCAIILIYLFVIAYFRPRGVQRAMALFLITYCLVASFTEVGFTDATPYLLELTLAASLLVPVAASGTPEETA
jgi:hypothetical protein